MNRILSGGSKTINKKIKRTLVKKIINWKDYNPSNNHYIFSDPRGGSTWLIEVIQKITRAPIIWEPLHLGLNNNPFRNLNFGWRQYIPEISNWLEAEQLFDQLFSGKILTENILNHSSFSQVLNSKKLLFKICRGNALLPWLTNKYKFRFKPVYLIRHPFAVVNSQIQHGAWNYSFSGFKIPNTPYNFNYFKHKSFLESLVTREEALVAEWCISNTIPLNHESNNIKWLTINYEEFVINPENTIDRILSSWGLDYDLSSIDFTKISKTTNLDNIVEGSDRIFHWQNSINNITLAKMEQVLEYFQIKPYSKNNPMPEIIYNYG
ncbi:hypothetical protein [Cyclobacterium plantarum]|uniref:hypothetical protein n=1 Tax=Cyclobacterium plantarum TaxID=2716263 RepID=UPI003F6EDCAD